MDPVISVIQRSNQRGGRMLSVVDLLEEGTLDPDQAAWLVNRIRLGSSWLVGARPGGAGKTTVMSALLAMVPRQGEIRLANLGTGWKHSKPGDCIVAYELSPGSYDAYIWGEDVRHFARLGARGCRVVSNLHADTLAEARDQIIGQCGSATEEFDGFQIFLPVSFSGGFMSPRRKVEKIYAFIPESAGGAGGWQALREPPSPSPEEEAIAAFLVRCGKSGIRRVEEVREAWLAWSEARGYGSISPRT